MLLSYWYTATQFTLWKVLALGIVPVGCTAWTSSPVLADKAPRVTRIFMPPLEDCFQSLWKSHKLAGYYTQAFHSTQRYCHRCCFKQSRKLLSSKRKGVWVLVFVWLVFFFNQVLKPLGLIFSFPQLFVVLFSLLSLTSFPVFSFPVLQISRMVSL